MNTPAIHQAVHLKKFPEEMAWLCLPDSDIPDGITDLLRLCSSNKQLIEFADTNGFDPIELSTALLNFIEQVIVNDSNSDEKVLGCDKFASPQLHKFHYQLLMKIYHPDLNVRNNADYYASIITKAYQGLKVEERSQEAIRFSESRRPPKSYYQATRKAETQISNTKSAVAIFSAITILALVASAGKFYNPIESELITADNAIQESIIEAQQLIQVSAVKSDTPQDTEIKLAQTTNTKLQMLLKDLEVAYEKGDVDAIKPILANAPEIKDQTDKQLNEKLITLFEITEERKMVLFDFNWESVTGMLKGKGKFLSRYKLVGETKWLTREGSASISAESVNEKLKITQLILENQIID